MANVFAASYDRLTVEQQRSFRLLGTHPDPEYNVTRAATLLGMNPESAERVLEELLDVHLLIQDKVGRYRLHPLLREYARSMGGDEAAA